MNKITDTFKTIILQISKFKIYYKIAILIILGFLLYISPAGWIKYGVIPAITEILFYYIAINIGFSFIKIFLVYLYKRRNKFSKEYYDNFILGIERLSFLIGNITFFIVLMYLLGINVEEFLTSISIFAVALVLVFKDYISNAINGLILMFSHDFKLKEYIRIGDYKGKIKDITFLNTELRTDHGDIVFIPNTLMLSSYITNYSKSNIKKIEFNFSLDPQYWGKVNQLEKYVAKKLCYKFGNLVTRDDFLIKAVEIKKDEALFNIEINVNRYNFKIENEIKNYLSKQVLKFLYKQADIPVQKLSIIQ